MQQQNSKKLFSLEQSQTIMNRIKFLRVKKLFDAIDCEKNGYISKESISRFHAEPQLMRILRPVFEDIINRNTNISLVEFEDKMDWLLMKISSNDRMALLDVKS